LDELKKYLEDFTKEISQAKSLDELNRVKGKYVGRKGLLNRLFQQLAQLSPEERKNTGRKLNQLKQTMESMVKERMQQMQSSRTKIENAVDITLPGKKQWLGSYHPLLIMLDQIIAIFKSLGFRVETGPEIETEHYNFEALNMPEDHPARDEQDSFYLDSGYLLRTHTSPGQIRALQRLTPPFKVIIPGKCYRRDAFDASHSPVFHQVEGLVVADSISMGDLKGTIEVFVRRLFGPERKVRFRPSYFPFTEPSAEVDISCGICGGKGCQSCGYSGWLEIMGSGLVHPNVFRNAGCDPDKLRGFAFGMGVERIALLVFGIPDIRWFFENDIQFLDQFRIFR